MKSAIVGISYNEKKNFNWTKLWAGQLRRFLPDETIVMVDHNNIEKEHQLCAKYDIKVIKNNNKTKTHGAGVDAAAAWCRANGITTMIHIEPDVAIYGRNWFDKMILAIEKGYWVSGMFQRAYCPKILHGSVSAWNLDRCKHSFMLQPKMHDLYDKSYIDLIDERTIYEIWGKHSLTHIKFFLYNWDMGDKNWFEAYKSNKYFKIESNDCVHMWRSSFQDPLDRLLEEEIHQRQSTQKTKVDERFLKLVKEYIKPNKFL